MSQLTNMPDFLMITGNEGEERPSETVIREFEKAIADTNSVRVINADAYFVSRFLFRLWKPESVFRLSRLPLKILNQLVYRNPKNYFVVLMGPRFPKCFPYFLRNGRKAVFLFDAWPSYYPYITRFINDFKVDYVFVSSEQSAWNLNRIIGKKNVYWIPEGVNPGDYQFLPVENRDIDVLSFGRKYEDFHNKIAEPLMQEKINYLYSSANEKIFNNTESFIEGLSRTKISICFPTSLTHPQRAGNIETMTNRYLQSMASKCLVLGKAPDEMIRLFGYNPVVDADFNHPVQQIKDILDNFGQYTELIEKNYRNVVMNHAWINRWEKISEILSGKTNL